MEDPVPFEEEIGIGFHFSGFGIVLLLLNRLAVDAEAGLGTGVDTTALGLDLIPGKPFAGFAQQELVQHGIGLSCSVADRHGGIVQQRPSQDGPSIDNRCIQRAFGEHFHRDQMAIHIEEDSPELLMVKLGHGFLE